MGLVVAIKNSAEGLAAVHMSLFEPKWCLKDLNSYVSKMDKVRSTNAVRRPCFGFELLSENMKEIDKIIKQLIQH